MTDSKRHRALLFVLIIAVLFTACGGNSLADAPSETVVGENATATASEPTPNSLRTIIVGTTEAISSLDFADANTSTEWELLSNVNLGLLTFEAGTAKLAPGVASSYEVSEDGLHYTFRLESGWTYPDGRELIAYDFVRGIDRSIRLNGKASNLVNPIVESVVARDDNTLEITLTTPRGDFAQIVTSAAYMPLAEGQFPDDALDKFPDTIAGVGPWQIIEYASGEEIILERNPNFKLGFSVSAPDRVLVRYFDDSLLIANALEKGEIDVAWRSLDLSSIEHLNEIEDITIFESGFGGIRTLLFNHEDEYVRSKLVRQAIAHLIDRDALVEKVIDGSAHPLYSVVPPGFIGANQAFFDIYGGEPDIAAANTLLTEAGYFEFEPITITLIYPDEQYDLHTKEIAILIEQQLEAASAIQVTLQPLDWITFLGSLLSSEFQMLYLGWAFDRYPDTSNYLDTFALSEISSRIGLNYKLEEMDALLLAAGETADQEGRAQLYEEAQELYAQELVSIPLLFESEIAVWNNRVISELVIGPVGYLHYDLIQIAE